MSYRANMIGGIAGGPARSLRRHGGPLPVPVWPVRSACAAPVRRQAKHRVFVVDDHPIVRQGLALLIDQEPDLVVCGAAEEAESALAAIAASRPDILVLDISLRGRDGIELLKTIRSTDPDLPVLVLSMHDEAIYAERALRAGANGYIMKQEATENVLVALRRILRQEMYVSERIANRMLRQLVTHGAGSGRDPDRAAQRPRAGGVPADRWRTGHPADRRRAAG